MQPGYNRLRYVPCFLFWAVFQPQTVHSDSSTPAASFPDISVRPAHSPHRIINGEDRRKKPPGSFPCLSSPGSFCSDHRRNQFTLESENELIETIRVSQSAKTGFRPYTKKHIAAICIGKSAILRIEYADRCFFIQWRASEAQGSNFPPRPE